MRGFFAHDEAIKSVVGSLHDTAAFALAGTAMLH